MLQKASIPPTVLCKELPIEFSKILEYVLNLENGNDVDYTYIECLLFKAAEKNSIILDGVFDWYDLKTKEKIENRSKAYEKQKSQEPSLNSRNFNNLMAEENQNKSDISVIP